MSLRPGAIGSIAMIAIALVALVYAAHLCFFSIAIARLEAAHQDGSPNAAEAHQQAARTVDAWRGTYGFAGLAARALVLDDTVSMTVARRLQTDIAALSESPSDGLLWMSYARSTAQSGVDFKNVSMAVNASRLTGRREQVVMVDRILFTLSNWQRFTPEERAAALREVRDLRWFLRPPERAAIDEAVAASPTAVQDDLKKQVAQALAN